MDRQAPPTAPSTDQTADRQAARPALPLELQRMRQIGNAALSELSTPDLKADGYEWPANPDLEAWLDAQPEDKTVLEDAQDACYGDRNTDYGHPREDFTRQAILWTGLLNHKLADGQFIEAEDIARCMVATKLARDVHSPKRDNRVDGAGYFLCLDRLETGK